METSRTDTRSITTDLSWVDMLKGIAIIGVFYDNWRLYIDFEQSPQLFYLLAKSLFAVTGPFVQVFFILSGFGLTFAYLKRQSNWSWGKWGWRRITKILVPYEIIVLFTFGLGLLGMWLYQSIDLEFSWKALFAYLTLTRNFFPSTWEWNSPLWFMPVIVGLYISFPLLLWIFQRWGSWMLLVISFCITYGTLMLSVMAGRSGGHAADIFTFWIIQFALGMVLARVRFFTPEKLRPLVSFGAFLLGLGLFAFSWAVKTYLPLGKEFNDMFTSVGIFLILLNLGWLSRKWIPGVGSMLNALSGKSYLMYLIHYPIMVFLIGPPINAVINNPLTVVLGGAVYIAAIFCLSYVISYPIDRFSSWLYQLPGRYYDPDLAQTLPHRPV